MVMFLLLVFIIFTISFLIRIWFKPKKRFVAEDSWYHLLAVDILKKRKLKLPEETGFFLLGKGYDYPPLLHYILAFFPKNEKIYFIFSPFIDAIHATIIFLFTFFITKNFFVATTAGIIFSINPLCSSGSNKKQGIQKTSLIKRA